MLVRLLYASRAVDTSAAATRSHPDPVAPAQPRAAASPASLCYGGGVFLQAIEGGRSAVNDLYGHIQRDPRHKNDGAAALRRNCRTALWRLDHGAGEASPRSTISILLKYSEKPSSTRMRCRAGVVALLEELMATASIIGRA